MITALARAKVNLALHVVGRRADGYHLLDSLVIFPEIGDRITVTGSDGLTLSITGPQADALLPEAEDNLVLKAARSLLKSAGARNLGAHIHLEKHLPVASGIGGGSADAATCLTLLNGFWDLGLSSKGLHAQALSLGADVPMCLSDSPLRAQGIGADLTAITPFPSGAILLVNPGVGVSTPTVFKALKSRDNEALPPMELSRGSLGDLASWLGRTRNDLQEAAISVTPAIQTVLDWFKNRNLGLLTRMSGSGATCYALFDTLEEAEQACSLLRKDHPGWWVRAGTF